MPVSAPPLTVNQPEDLFGNLFKLVQAVKIHGNNNHIVVQSAQRFVAAITSFKQEEDRLVIKSIKGRFYLQNEKIPLTRDNLNLLNSAMAYFEKRNLFGLAIDTDLQKVAAKEILDFARTLNQAVTQAEPAAWLEAQIEENGWNWLEILNESDSSAEPPSDALQSISIATQDMDTASASEDLSGAESGQRIYASTLTALKDVAGKVSLGRPAGVRKTVRMVQNMVDLVFKDRPVLLALSTLRDFDDSTYTHSVNVAILAICLGLKICLSRNSLETLGICGLLHDLGKLDIPTEVLNKPGKLDRKELDIIQRHTLKSVQQIVKLRVSRRLKARIMLPPFEHHLKYDLTGYPQTFRKKPVSLFGRILTIVDVFDAVTSPRVYRKKTMSPDQALGWMMQLSGKDFDPLLLKVFINMMGTYPVGTLVVLDSGEMAVVKQNSDQDGNALPMVVILQPDGAGKYKKGPTLDLTAGSPPPKIVATQHPGQLGIQPAQFIL